MKTVTLLFSLIILLTGTAFAQDGERRFGQNNPETKMRDHPIIPYNTYGRFGQRTIRGSLVRTYPNSRFSDNGAIYDERGRWIGMSANPETSRFKQIPSDVYYRTQYENLRLSGQIADPTNPPKPLPVYEQPTPPVPNDRIDPRFREVPQPKNVLAERTLADSAPASVSNTEGQPTQQPVIQRREPNPSSPDSRQSNSQWFRGGTGGATRTMPAPQTQQGDVRIVGNNGATENIAREQMIPPMMPIPTPQQNVKINQKMLRKFEQNLEEMILSNPEVHLLSSVSVKFDNGTATISGLVTDKAGVVKAGEILLGAPGVKKVQNELTTPNENE